MHTLIDVMVNTELFLLASEISHHAGDQLKNIARMPTLRE